MTALPRTGAPPEQVATTATVADLDAQRRKRRRDPANRRFDTVKVSRLKDEIAAGRYEIDCWSVADRFIEHERNAR